MKVLRNPSFAYQITLSEIKNANVSSRVRTLSDDLISNAKNLGVQMLNSGW